MLNHFLERKHTVNDLQWVILEKLDEHIKNHEQVLYEKEQRWVHRLKTNLGGLNDEVQLGHFFR